MGTSKRKINEKIKELLKHTFSDEHGLDASSIPQFIPPANIQKYTAVAEFNSLFEGGLRIQKSIIKKDFSSLPFSESDLENSEQIKIEQIKEKILDVIEKESGQDFVPSLITNAFNNTMTEVVLGNISDSFNYIVSFCTNILYYIFLENTNEAIIDLFSNPDEVESFRMKRWEEINLFIKEKYKITIDDYLSKNLSLKELISKLSEGLE